MPEKVWTWITEKVLSKDSFGWPLIISCAAALTCLLTGFVTAPSSIGAVWLLTCALVQGALNVISSSRPARLVQVRAYQFFKLITKEEAAYLSAVLKGKLASDLRSGVHQLEKAPETTGDAKVIVNEVDSIKTPNDMSRPRNNVPAPKFSTRPTTSDELDANLQSTQKGNEGFDPRTEQLGLEDNL